MLHADWRQREMSIDSVAREIEGVYGGRSSFLSALGMGSEHRSEYLAEDRPAAREENKLLRPSESEVFLMRASTFLDPLESPETAAVISATLRSELVREAWKNAYRAAFAAATAAEFKDAHAKERELRRMVNQAERAFVPLCAQLPLHCAQFAPEWGLAGALALLVIIVGGTFTTWRGGGGRGGDTEPPLPCVRCAAPALGFGMASWNILPFVSVCASIVALVAFAVGAPTLGDRLRLLSALARSFGLAWLWLFNLGGSGVSLTTLCTLFVIDACSFGYITTGLGRPKPPPKGASGALAEAASIPPAVSPKGRIAGQLSARDVHEPPPSAGVPEDTRIKSPRKSPQQRDAPHRVDSKSAPPRRRARSTPRRQRSPD
jgi:hypothetical protein